ncbi:hypothetical protein PISMIDRAFT_690404 [Pisolithus microcarpus 441]|uniref:Uncharacterized protein n=1 Tax=Pisolithus microcarpus 441 TaxID=765257 RepID=A0A0C9YM59_9AGAM|nr:hypothetical protein PISMIDRAFT_690404 [Pisolithus microcarpus 441]
MLGVRGHFRIWQSQPNQPLAYIRPPFRVYLSIPAILYRCQLMSRCAVSYL